jgi:hypothetical protein
VVQLYKATSKLLSLGQLELAAMCHLSGRSLESKWRHNHSPAPDQNLCRSNAIALFADMVVN